jgi:hypothetical protein
MHSKHHELKLGSVSVCVCARTGKIVSLASGKRQWLLPGPAGALEALASGNCATQERFTIEQAWGADECFPTVAGLTDPFSGTSSLMRDHGVIWGREGVAKNTTEISQSFEWKCEGTSPPSNSSCTDANQPGVLTRSLRLETTVPQGFRPAIVRLWIDITFPSQIAIFQMSIGKKIQVTLDSLYAFHSLFQMETQSQLTLFGKDEAPVFSALFPPPEQPIAQKFFVLAKKGRIEHPDGSRLDLVAGAGIEGFGIWWCNNGWGDGREHRTVGLEPTSHLCDGPLVAPQSTQSEKNLKRVSFALEFSP